MKNFQLSTLVMLFLTLTAVVPSAFGAAWVSTHKWSDTPPGQPLGTTYEDLYSKEMAYGPSENMFATGQAHFVGQPDCAKTAALIRCDWASKHSVPCRMDAAGINSNTFSCSAGAGTDDCLKSFMKSINTNVNTNTVSNDTYPVRVNRQNVKGGTIYLLLEGGQSSHTLTITSVKSSGRPKFIYGTTIQGAKEIQNAQKNYIFTTEAFYPDESPYTHGRDGLRRWRHEDEYSRPQDEPGYSLEQFQPEFTNGYASWAKAAGARIELYPGGIENYFTEEEANLCKQVQDVRKKVVWLGEVSKQEQLRKNRDYKIDKKKDPLTWENSSTENRDKRLQDSFDALENELARFEKDPDYQTYVDDKTDAFNRCEITYGPNPYQKMNLSIFEEIIRSGNISYDPNKSLDEKWGNVNYDIDASLTNYLASQPTTSVH